MSAKLLPPQNKKNKAMSKLIVVNKIRKIVAKPKLLCPAPKGRQCPNTSLRTLIGKEWRQHVTLYKLTEEKLEVDRNTALIQTMKLCPHSERSFASLRMM